MSTNSETGKKIYLKIRNQCGIMGVLLPWLALFSAGIAEHPADSWWWSISATYYQSPALVGVMVPMCLVLFSYIGYDRTDNLVTDLGGLFGLGLVLFPCNVAWIPDGTRVGFFQVPIEISHVIHSVCACLFFLVNAVNIIFLFTKSKPGCPLSPRKKIRNRIYHICGWSMILLEFLFVPALYGLFPMSLNIVTEVLLLTVFGFAWLVKGEFFPFLNDVTD